MHFRSASRGIRRRRHFLRHFRLPHRRPFAPRHSSRAPEYFGVLRKARATHIPCSRLGADLRMEYRLAWSSRLPSSPTLGQPHRGCGILFEQHPAMVGKRVLRHYGARQAAVALVVARYRRAVLSARPSSCSGWALKERNGSVRWVARFGALSLLSTIAVERFRLRLRRSTSCTLASGNWQLESRGPRQSCRCKHIDSDAHGGSIRVET